MQPISAFNEAHGTAILLLGPPGSGKTTLGLRLFPDTYAIVADLNFQSGLRHLRKINELDNIVGFDTPAIKEGGEKVIPNQWYDRMFKFVNDAIADPKVGTVFVDSVTFVEDYIKAKICGAMMPELIKLEGFDKWGMYLTVWKSLITQLRMSGKRIILSAHEEKEPDKADGIFKYGIAVDGKIKSKFGALCSDVWRCEVAESGIGATAKHSWMVRTLGNVSHELKNTFGLPALLPQDELVKKVREQIQSTKK